MFPPSKAYHLPYAIDDHKPCKQHVFYLKVYFYLFFWFNFFYQQIISMTGFEGEERLRVKEMILRTGAKYTNYLTQKNTIIVCKRFEFFSVKFNWNQNLFVIIDSKEKNIGNQLNGDSLSLIWFGFKTSSSVNSILNSSRIYRKNIKTLIWKIRLE